MAYTTSLSIGPVYTLTQNVVYALPARRCKIFAQNNPTTLEQSNDGTTFVAVTNSNNMVEPAGGFIRSTGVDTIVNLKAAD